MVKTRLTSQTRMECKAGTMMSPRKAPISPRGILPTPESDCNSNNLNLTNDISSCTEKMQDFQDIFQDNSEYQWFLDYGYKDNTQHQQSVFSILSSHDMLYYDDLARDLDANLAEVDMDDFDRGDIHSVLSTLPNMCSSDIQGVEEREMFASVSESMMIKFGLDCSSPHSSSQEENSNSISVCKSELLFSPVRESFLPNGNLSVDSLDLSENEINLLITCQANKTNYTIAFEGSTVMGSDDSVYPETAENPDGETVETESSRNYHDDKHNFPVNVNNSMTRSDSVYTTWSKIKQRSSAHLQLMRQPSGNNNPTSETISDCRMGRSSTTVKSHSLPNLFRQKRKQSLGLSVSSRFGYDLVSPAESKQQCIKLYNIKKSNNSENDDDQSISSVGDDPGRPHNLNLVKLFIKQKSASHEGMCNYTSDRPFGSSYSEGNYQSNSFGNTSKKDCGYINSNNSGQGKLLKHNECPKNRKTVHDCSAFEDSLFNKNLKSNEAIQEKENSDSESVEQITESSKQITESVEQISESYSTSEQFVQATVEESSHKNRRKVQGRNSYAFNLNNNNSMLENHKNKYLSDESTQDNGSNTESTENMTCNCRKLPTIRMKANVMEKSIQTSKLLENGENYNVKEVKVPAYILYPNYSLPNLEFLKEKHYVQNIDFTKIFLRPQTYKVPECVSQSPKRRNKVPGRRPFSVNDIESLKRTGFKHVRDWDSLTFLLPKEYKEFLQDIPEIVTQLKDMKNMKEDLKPLFCLNPASKKIKKRPISCDSNFFITDCRSSNYSSTATQPSSGYRGSSTMLSSNNSNTTPSPKNATTGFRYDNNDSVFNSRKSTPPKSGSLLGSHVSDESHARPPLPRSILRNNSLDSTKYTCKTQKENANKRYSMIEFSEKNLETNEKLIRRKSTQDPYYLKSPQKYQELSEEKCGCDRKKNNFQFARDKYDAENSLSFKSSNLESDMRRLEELLEISAVFGESMESFTENDVHKLRSQVSRFLTMQKNLQKVSDCLQTLNENHISKQEIVEGEDSYKEKRFIDIKHSQTPNNTPEHKKKPNLTLGEGYESDVDISSCTDCHNAGCQDFSESPDYRKDEINYKEEALRGLKKTVSFAEKISSLVKEPGNKDITPPNSPITPSLHPMHKVYQNKSLKLVDVHISEESYETTPTESPKKTAESGCFLLHKRELIFDVKNAVEKIIHRSAINNDKLLEDLSNLCLHHLCPSLYAVLSDGLKEEIDTPFGAIRNSVWGVIEASSQQGPLTETLNHLVQRLNRDDVLSEGLVKFNAFVFGLLNVSSLDSWLSYLRTRDSLLHKYYNNRSLLLLSNSAGAPIRIIMDQLIRIVQPLSEIKFNLDLMYQAKLLHCSLQNLNCLLEAAGNDLVSPSKQLVLLKLVQSIQSSINHPSDGRKCRQSSEEVEKSTDDSSVPQLLVKRGCPKPQGSSRPRPRSGCDILSTNNISDVASCAKKRWSGVQLNSKLLQAFERLGEESESEYTDSLDNVREKNENQSPSARTISKRLQNSDETSGETSHTWNDTDSSEVKTKEERKNILSNLNKKNCNRIDVLKTDLTDSDKSLGTRINIQNGGHKFKRMQLKWEKLGGKSGSDVSGQNSPVYGASPNHRSRLPTPKQATPEKPFCDSNVSLTSPTSRISRIPRPVSSPVQTTPINEKTSAAKKLSSPTHCSTNSNPEKGGEKHSNLNKSNCFKPKTTPSRVSRVDEASDSEAKARAVRPSSLPYRGASTLPAKKNVPNRASSTSLNRTSIKKRQSAPRVVRTLSHRLPSDSGHLSFNEGEKLKVVLEVDETWLLCCRGTQKGLVPRSAVIPVPDHILFK
ncbi:UNVERIFIED_CONTAM: hypothetical protein PYX00_008782 [Menopon gallinae]|uniref:Iporin n=1 Tax=Menopon gallinae TaxID=328185 RepID=A0AAW2HQA7_9NEOP